MAGSTTSGRTRRTNRVKRAPSDWTARTFLATARRYQRTPTPPIYSPTTASNTSTKRLRRKNRSFFISLTPPRTGPFSPRLGTSQNTVANTKSVGTSFVNGAIAHKSGVASSTQHGRFLPYPKDTQKSKTSQHGIHYPKWRRIAMIHHGHLRGSGGSFGSVCRTPR